MPGEASRANGQKGGRPKGAVSKATIDKAVHREVLRQIVVEHLREMTAAQIANAKGLKYLVVRDKRTGKFLRVTEGMAKQRAALADTEEVIEVWEKDPSVQAFADLLNRALDKPAEQVELTGADKGPLEIIVRKPW